MADRVLVGDGTWGAVLTAAVDGVDVTGEGEASWFDDDHTASGSATSGIGVALPMAVAGRPHYPQTEGSPLPDMPYGMAVRVFCPATGERTTVAPLIDRGPAKSTGRAVDMTRQTFLALGLEPAAGVARVEFRVFCAAEYVYAQEGH